MSAGLKKLKVWKRITNFFNSIIGPPRESEKVGRELDRIAVFTFSRQLLFHNNSGRCQPAVGFRLILDHFPGRFCINLGALLQPGLQWKPKENNGFWWFRGFKKGSVLWFLFGSFCTKYSVRLEAERRPATPLFSGLHFFKTITFSIQFRPLPAGLKKFGPDRLGFWCFHFFRPNFFNTTIPGPAGELESGIQLKML